MKFIKVSGNASERGLIHGESLKYEINQMLEYYRPHFCQDREKLERHVSTMTSKVKRFRPDLLVEMEAIARAAGVEPFWIYCLNARSELMLSANECSVIAFPEQGLIGQNWDWATAIADLLVVMEVELDNEQRFLTLTEPGILGKIGMNQSGLGICLNILPANKPLNGIPVHLLLRCLLECPDIESARTLIEHNGAGQASHILVGSADSGCFGVELGPEHVFFQEANGRSYCHTNHYFAPNQAIHSSLFECSQVRLDKLEQQIGSLTNLNLDSMRSVLDEQDSPFPVLRESTCHEMLGMAGTLATVLIDLSEREIRVREGSDPTGVFSRYHFSG